MGNVLGSGAACSPTKDRRDQLAEPEDRSKMTKDQQAEALVIASMEENLLMTVYSHRNIVDTFSLTLD